MQIIENKWLVGALGILKGLGITPAISHIE
jgi:hypothetical protein